MSAKWSHDTTIPTERDDGGNHYLGFFSTKVDL